MKLTIYAVHDKEPDFVAYQVRCFKRFLKDPFTFVVADNALSRVHSECLQSLCKEQECVYLKIPNQHHENPNVACAYPLDYLTHEVLPQTQTDEISVFIDSDMFLIKEFSFMEYAECLSIAGVFQKRSNACGKLYYLWNALVVINHTYPHEMDKILWACSASSSSPYYPQHLYDRKGRLLGNAVDVGGPTFFYIQNRVDSVGFIDCRRIEKQNHNLHLMPKRVWQEWLTYNDENNEVIIGDLLLQGHFYHYRSGSNWNHKTAQHRAQKERMLRLWLDAAFAEEVQTYCVDADLMYGLDEQGEVVEKKSELASYPAAVAHCKGSKFSGWKHYLSSFLRSHTSHKGMGAPKR